MTPASRFTSRYDPIEDRVQVLLERPDEEVLTLWLTRRMLNRMLPPLLNRVEGTGPSGGPEPEVGPGKTPKGAKAAVQRFQQEAAVSAIERQPAVTPDTDAPASERIAYLVTKIDIRTGPKSVVLDFKSGDDILHSLPFGGDTLRQWLSILYSQYKAAKWDEPFWPVWIDTKAPSEGGKDDLRLN